MNWGSIFKWFTTLDYGNVADWVSAAATFIATATALFLSKKRDKAKLKFACHYDDGYIAIRALNTGRGIAKVSIFDVSDESGERAKYVVDYGEIIELAPFEFNTLPIVRIEDSSYMNSLEVVVILASGTEEYHVFLTRQRSGWNIIGKTKYNKYKTFK